MIELDVIGLTASPGWHVNASAPVAGWDACRVTPATPSRVFAGSQTIFYVFADAAAFTTALAGADLNPVPPTPVPSSVTMRQARLALLGAGKLVAVDMAINGLPEPQQSAARIEWDFSNEVQRHNGLIPLMAPALGLTAAQIDALFITAGGIT